MGANVKLMSLSQFAKLGCNAGVRCWCGRITTVDPAVLIGIARRHKLSLDRIDAVRQHLVCSMCGARGKVRIGWSWDTPGRVIKPGWRRPTEDRGPLG